MSMHIKLKFDLRRHYSRRVLFFVSLLFMITLVSFCFISVFTEVSSFAVGAPNKIVSNETELREAVKNTVESTIIILNKDIILTELPLAISTGADVTLTSSSEDGFFKLFGAYNQSTIVVENQGLLTIAGVIVTHANGVMGRGVTVNSGGTLILSDGEISGNTIVGSKDDDRWTNDLADGNGGGVLIYNCGNFSMFGGMISKNTATGGFYGGGGGGVYNLAGNFSLHGGMILDNTGIDGGGVCSSNGNFSMYGGVISNNTATNGGGVNAWGTFKMFGGEISGNTANGTYFAYGGGGVYGGGLFEISGGVISNNIATNGGGVNARGNFSLFGDGMIFGNTGTEGGGVYIWNECIFNVLDGGVIFNNSAAKGGGVYSYYNCVVNLFDGGIISNNTADVGGGVCIDGNFIMTGGDVADNIAKNQGGGVYIGNGVFKLYSGKILGNTAINGGGIWVDADYLGSLFVFDDAVFSNNYASVAYVDRDSVFDDMYNLYIGSKVVWTAPFKQGYNNYDIGYSSDIPPANTDEAGNANGKHVGVNGGDLLYFLIIAIVLGSVVSIGLFFCFFKDKSSGLRKKWVIPVVLIMILLFSLSICVFVPWVGRQNANIKNGVHVGDVNELKKAIDNAPDGVRVAIIFDKGIALTESLIIPANKDISLSSNSNFEFFKLVGMFGTSTIIVESDSVLRLDGINVTHANGATGTGVTINSDGTLIMSDGVIFGNTCGYAEYAGGGVANNGGAVNLLGGAISNNKARAGSGIDNNYGTVNVSDGVIANNTAEEYGGGVANRGGIFSMSGGIIVNNTATTGGGVHIWTATDFAMSGGIVSNNTANEAGGGVYIYGGVFEMSGVSIISGNSATTYGGGVYNDQGIFNMMDGNVSNNRAVSGGGVYNSGTSYVQAILGRVPWVPSDDDDNYDMRIDGNFTMHNGVIFGNIAKDQGGGVYNKGNFQMINGEISDNVATNGGGIYNKRGELRMSGGKNSDNIASENGGGIAVPSNTQLEWVYISNNAAFSNNRAAVAYNRNPTDDTLYNSRIANKVTWTSPFTQGYNNYDISYTSNLPIALIP